MKWKKEQMLMYVFFRDGTHTAEGYWPLLGQYQLGPHLSVIWRQQPTAPLFIQVGGSVSCLMDSPRCDDVGGRAGYCQAEQETVAQSHVWPES